MRRHLRRLLVPLVTACALVPAFGGGDRALGLRSASAQDASPGTDRPTGGLWGPGAGLPSLDPEELARLGARAEREDRPADWLALGAALLATGDWEGATAPLRRALEAEDPAVREDAAYDLALAFAVAGRPETEGGEPAPPTGAPGDANETRERLLQARDGFRAVLRADPGAEDARWNLELVDRWLRNESRGGGGGSGAQGGEGSGGGGEGAADLRAAPMTEEEARRLLDAAAGAERAVQERRLERNRSRDPAAERNW